MSGVCSVFLKQENACAPLRLSACNEEGQHKVKGHSVLNLQDSTYSFRVAGCKELDQCAVFGSKDTVQHHDIHCKRLFSYTCLLTRMSRPPSFSIVSFMARSMSSSLVRSATMEIPCLN